MSPDLLKELVGYFETHNMEAVKRSFADGINPNQLYQGKPLFEVLISMYTRSPKFKEIVKLFVQAGLEFNQPTLLNVLLDDSENLEKAIISDPSMLSKRYTLTCAYTPLKEVSLLHICAEYNHLECAKVLTKHGMDINFKAGMDQFGFGGHTPIFHTVNQNRNQSIEMMDFLLLHDCDLGLTVKGIVWGYGMDWETFIPSVNPVSYAMMGLLPQFHRNEQTVFETVSKLMKQKYGMDYFPKNIPNKYLNPGMYMVK